ncbi:MAG: CYTH domain-containing protein [Flavobacteriaceae bacterium]|nr:CYTH domain-containing protein [Flavobacteriaceae bacterium]
MKQEIERKFLVKNQDYKVDSYKSELIKQGYLNSNKNRTVRIRISDKKGFLTIKGKSNSSGTTRLEWEKEISVKEAEQLLLLCEKSVIEKTRHYIKHQGFIFEVDEFFGDNKGLTIAEVELTNENDFFSKPNWLGKEVTGIENYYNAFISKTPYSKW